MYPNEQTLTGRYYATEHRNAEDGTAVFTIVPQYVMPQATDGLLRCTGRIRLYENGMPVEITGCFDGNTFHVTSDHVWNNTYDATAGILECITQDLTERQKTSVANACNNDLFTFCQNDENLPVLRNLLKRTKGGNQTANLIFRRVRVIAARSKLQTLLMRHMVPFEQMEKMTANGVSLEYIKNNPYLVFSKYAIPVEIADRFARQECDIDDYDVIRIRGLVYATMKHLLAAGNTCSTIEQLERTLHRRYGGIMEVTHFGKTLINSCVMDMPDFFQYHTIDGQTYIYLNHVWEEETIAVRHLVRMKQTPKSFSCSVSVDDTEREIGIHYNAGQRRAFDLLRTSGIKILTGPPGSGKTAVISGLIRNFEANGNGTVALAATTGMAAKVMHAATNRESETAHKLLRVFPFHDTVMGRDLNDPVDADLIIVDEVSMMGLQLFSVLTRAVRNGSIVILVGDENQLQSVDYGNILHDLIDSEFVEVCRLTEILRQSGSICTNAIKVQDGDPFFDIDSSFIVKNCTEDTLFPQLLADYDPYDSQIICPIKNGSISTGSINQFIQAQHNGTSEIVAVYGKRGFRLQDKIIMTKTNYDRGYINGDMGYIIDRTQTGELAVGFASGIQYLSREDLCNMELAYAITIHKAQGSEFKNVHIVLPTDAANMMTRRLLYTAITRAKKKVIIYNLGDSMTRAVMDNAERIRFTLLGRRLKLCAEGKFF